MSNTEKNPIEADAQIYDSFEQLELARPPSYRPENSNDNLNSPIKNQENYYEKPTPGEDDKTNQNNPGDINKKTELNNNVIAVQKAPTKLPRYVEVNKYDPRIIVSQNIQQVQQPVQQAQMVNMIIPNSQKIANNYIVHNNSVPQNQGIVYVKYNNPPKPSQKVINAEYAPNNFVNYNLAQQPTNQYTVQENINLSPQVQMANNLQTYKVVTVTSPPSNEIYQENASINKGTVLYNNLQTNSTAPLQKSPQTYQIISLENKPSIYNNIPVNVINSAKLINSIKQISPPPKNIHIGNSMNQLNPIIYSINTQSQNQQYKVNKEISPFSINCIDNNQNNQNIIQNKNQNINQIITGNRISLNKVQYEIISKSQANQQYQPQRRYIKTPVSIILTKKKKIETPKKGNPVEICKRADVAYDVTLKNNYNNAYYDVNELLSQLLTKSQAVDDPTFDLDGWKSFYLPEDKFFNFNYGNTIHNQTIISNPDNLEKCEIYRGEINVNGQRHGFGVLFTSKYIKRGDFRFGEFTGWGRQATKHTIIEAKFVDGLANGKGMSKNHRGNKYLGDFVDGKKKGRGVLETKKFYYDGEFADDKLNGFGVIKFIDQDDVYVGQFKNNEIDGIGTFKWENGDLYEGQMSKGKMDGKGKYISADHQIYEGGYKDGLKCGRGKLTFPSGKIFQGYFYKGVANGKGSYVNENKVIPVKFHMGSLVNLDK